MAPSVASVGTFLALTSATTAAVPVPAGVAAGDVVFVHLYLERDRDPITAPAGFTAVAGNPNFTSQQWEYLFWKRATAADSGSYTFSWTTTAPRSARAYRVAGAVTTGTPFDTPSRAARSTTGTVTPAVSVNAPGGDRLLLWFATNFAAGTWTPPAGYTELADNGEITAASAVQVPAGSTGSVTGTGSNSGAQTASLLSVIPDAPPNQTVTATGIASAEAFGTTTVTRGAVTTSPTGISTAEAHGSTRVALKVTPAGIVSGEAFGSPAVAVSGVVIPSGIASTAALGVPTLTVTAVTVSAGSIASAEAFGTARIQLRVSPAGVPTAEAVGTPSVVVGAAAVTGTGIASDEAFGTALLVSGPITTTATGIPTAEAFGTARVSFTLRTTGIPTGQAFGVATLLAGAVTVAPTGITSREAFGDVLVTVTLDPTLRTAQRRPRSTPLYELLVVARIPQQSGPPILFDVDAIEWSKLNWGDTLSRPQNLSVTCKRSSITEPVAQRLRAPEQMPTELWLQRNGVTVFAGPLLGGAPQGGDDIRLEAGGLLTYTQGMFIEATKRFTQVDQFTIAAWLIDQWQELEYGHFGIDTSGVGESGRLRDRTYERDEQHFIDRRLQELGAVLDGFDTEVDPTTRRLQLSYPTKGIDRSSGEDAIVFDARNIDSGDGLFALGPGDLASEAYGTGTSVGADTTLYSHRTNLELRKSFGRWAVAGSWSDVSLQGTLDEHVAALLAARKEPLRTPGRKVRVTPDSDLSAYGVGDTVSFELDRLLGIGGAYRIRSRTVDVDASGQESVDLEFV